MYYLRTLSLHDVVHALQRREPRLALRISSNLCSNALNTWTASSRKSGVTTFILAGWLGMIVAG
jgi:hypothetical protein